MGPYCLNSARRSEVDIMNNPCFLAARLYRMRWNCSTPFVLPSSAVSWMTLVGKMLVSHVLDASAMFHTTIPAKSENNPHLIALQCVPLRSCMSMLLDTVHANSNSFSQQHQHIHRCALFARLYQCVRKQCSFFV